MTGHIKLIYLREFIGKGVGQANLLDFVAAIDLIRRHRIRECNRWSAFM